jgi:uncharacterized protein (TIGR03437 family)
MFKTFLMLSGALLAAAASQAQNFDTSGTGSLSGPYLFRYVTFFNDQNGNVTESCSLTGTMTFNGSGNYAISSSTQIFDSAGSNGAGSCTSLGTGTYGVQSNGIAQLDNPMFSATLFGSFTSPVVMASSTEDDFWDLFIAVQAPAASSSNSVLSGAFTVGTLDFLNASITLARQGFFTLDADGKGNIAAFTLTGSEANSSDTQLTQNVAASTYSLSGSAGGSVTFPGSSTDQVQIVAGPKVLYVSADGNYLVGGSATGSDIYFGFRAPSGNASNSLLNGTYFISGMDAAIGGLSSSGGNFLDSFYGSINTNGSGNLIWHQRLDDIVDIATFDNTFNSSVTIASNGTYFDGTFNNLAGANGGALMLVGSGSQFSLNIGIQAPSITPTSTIWINPIGITNAANFTPITNAYAPGELVDIFGTFGVSTDVDTTIPIPTKLNGVQVMVSGTPAPVYLVSASQISAIIPYEISVDFFLTFQVIVNGSASNSVTVFEDSSSPGIYTLSQNGLGAGAILHSNFTEVTDSSPAQPGETVLLFMNGLGTVTPSVADGAPGLSNPLSYSDEFNAGNIGVILLDSSGNSAPANVDFAGLAPCCAGLYQVNFTLPSSGSIGNGDASVVFETLEAQNIMSTIAVSGFTGAAISATANARGMLRPRIGAAAPRSRSVQSHRRALPERTKER